MIKIVRILLFILFIFLLAVRVQAGEESSILDSQLDLIEKDVSEISDVIGKNSNEAVNSVDFINLVKDAISGKVKLSPEQIMNSLINSLLGEIQSLMSLTRYMLIVAILSAILRAFTISFKSVNVAEVGFLVNYVMVITLLVSSFSICIGIMQDMVYTASELVRASQPMIVSLVLMSGHTASAFTFGPFILFAASFLTRFLADFVAPVIILAAVLQLINCLTEKERLKNLADFFKKAVSKGLLAVAIIFMAVLALQRISTPILNNAAMKSGKVIIGVVPVVGEALSGAVETVAQWASALRSGAMVGLVILVILVCSAPIIKIAAFVITYKLTAALIEPVCDARIVKAIDSAGTFSGLALGVCLTTAVLIIFMVMAILSI